MNPLQKNKALNEEEKKLLGKYGKLPQRKDLLSNKLKERKYFDSGDYALSKAGKASDAGITNGPQGQGIGMSSSPVKESSLLHENFPPSQSQAAKDIAAAQEA